MVTSKTNWKITFYSEKVEDQTLALPKSILANFLRIAELVEEFGPDLGQPHTAPLRQGLYEIRAKGKEGISRSVFCMVKEQEIIILLTVIKKGNTIARQHMETARKRFKEIKDEK